MIVAWKPGTTLAQTDKRGMLWAIGAAFFFSINTCFDKLAVRTASPTLAAFSVTLVAGLLLLPTVWRSRDNVESLRHHHRAFLLRGFFELLFMVAKLSALVVLSAPAVMALQRISLVLNVVGGRTIFEEKDFARRLVAALLVFSGVVLVIVGE